VLIRRRIMKPDTDPMAWAGNLKVAHGKASIDTMNDELPGGPAGDRATMVLGSGEGQVETDSRREASMIDLQNLNRRISRRDRAGGPSGGCRGAAQAPAGVPLHQSHGCSWSCMELYTHLQQPAEWESASELYKTRFRQSAPKWEAASTRDAELLNDLQLVSEVIPRWATRTGRMWIRRWMLGDPSTRKKMSGPPLLALGVYRDLLFLDEVLDVLLDDTPAEPATPGAAAAESSAPASGGRENSTPQFPKELP
jgi:hypothetical protein